jgi:hypothetical protein
MFCVWKDLLIEGRAGELRGASSESDEHKSITVALDEERTGTGFESSLGKSTNLSRERTGFESSFGKSTSAPRERAGFWANLGEERTGF